MDTYLSWMSLNTPTKWWHDSANPDEINAAIQDGALGVTTNPVLTYRTLKQDGAFWRGEVERLPQSLSPSERAESLLRIIATHAADKLRPVFEATSRAHGYALGQLNPEYAGDGERMYDQALRYISWGSNIAIKLPTTQAALPVIERLAARGTAVCTTLNFTAAQAIAAAEAYERGAARALRSHPALSYSRAGGWTNTCWTARATRGWTLLPTPCGRRAMPSQSGYTTPSASTATPPGSCRLDCTVEHLTRFCGADMVFSLQPRVQRMINGAAPPCEPHIDDPTDPAVVARLLRIPEFARAYEPDGMKPGDFITFGLTQRTLSQFLWTGWAPLETYGADGDSNRWF